MEYFNSLNRRKLEDWLFLFDRYLEDENLMLNFTIKNFNYQKRKRKMKNFGGKNGPSTRSTFKSKKNTKTTLVTIQKPKKIALYATIS